MRVDGASASHRRQEAPVRGQPARLSTRCSSCTCATGSSTTARSKLERARFDRYVASIADAPVDGASRDEQIAFWLNAYDALVLQTVIDHYPIAAAIDGYPARSIRQIPGAFERLPHRVGGRS